MSDDLKDPIPNILTLGSLNLLAGASGIGKTALLAWFLKQLHDGAPIFGHATNSPPAIGYLSADRHWRSSRDWFEKVGFPEIRHYSVVDDHALALPTSKGKGDKVAQRVGFFELCVSKLDLPPGSFLAVDPIALYLGGNLLDYDTVALSCISIHRLLDKWQYCCWGMAHASKQKGDEKNKYTRLQERISGTNALLGFTGTQGYLAPPEETGKDTYTYLWNPHNAPAETFDLVKNPDTGLFEIPTTALVPAAVVPPSRPPLDTLDPFAQTLYALFPTPPASVTIAQLGHVLRDEAKARETIWRHLKDLIAAGYICKAKYGAYARVP